MAGVLQHMHLMRLAALCRCAKMGIGLAVTDTSTERRYNAAIDGPATSLLTLPLRSDGAAGDLLAVLSLRKVAGGGAGRHARPAGFHRDEETFARAIVQATGPFLYTVQTAAAVRRSLEEEVAAVERMQQVRAAAVGALHGLHVCAACSHRAASRCAASSASPSGRKLLVCGWGLWWEWCGASRRVSSMC